MRYFITHITEVKLPMAIMLLVICLVGWIPNLIDNTLFSSICLLLTIVNSLLLTQVCYSANISRSRSLLPVVIYLLLFSMIEWVQTEWKAQIVISAVFVVAIILQKTYRHEKAVEQSFLTTLILLAASILIPDLIFFIPFLWLCFLFQQSMNLKVWLSSINAIVLVAIYVTLMYLFNYDNLIPYTFNDLTDRTFILSNISNFTDKYPISIIYLEVLSLILIGLSVINLNRQNISVQSFVIIFIILLIPALVLSLWSINGFYSSAYLLFVSLSALCAYYFQNDASLAKGIIFIVTVLSLIGTRIWFYIF